MIKSFNRRDFIKSLSAAGVGMSMVGSRALSSPEKAAEPAAVGIIGLDTSHSIAFTDIIHDPEGGAELSGFRVTTAYPYGSRTIESSYSRIPQYIEDIKERGVEVVDSIDELLAKADVVLLETNDGHLHLEQALQVMETGKRMFIDKPVAGSLKDTVAIMEASKTYDAPIFSSSGLRYIEKAHSIRNENRIGRVLGADVYSPATIESTHPDLFWYGIHGVETLFTVMGTGCRTVTRTSTEDTDIVVGTWEDDRLGTFRGIRGGRSGYGGTAFGSDEILSLGSFTGYKPLVAEILEFFRTGVTPVSLEETLEIYAFMEAADESKRQGGAPVDLDDVLAKAKS
ncbi:MAG: Gfo/Idh/MocA family oxidoreductase [Balneolaceae bacterium]